jgi:ADP-ribosylglycohydrolase
MSAEPRPPIAPVRGTLAYDETDVYPDDVEDGEHQNGDDGHQNGVDEFEANGVEDTPLFDQTLIRDRLFGAVFGAAVADALALPVEGEEPVTIAERFGPNAESLSLPYKGIYRGYVNGDWTDATDTTVLVMRSLADYFLTDIEDAGIDFASKLVKWNKGGFFELEDATGLTPESVVIRSMGQAGFLEDPVSAAAAVKGPKAENGALIRTLPCAFTAAPRDWALVFSKVTHADDRSNAAALSFTLLIHALIRLPAGVNIPPEIARAPISAGRALIAPEAKPKTDPNKVTRREDFMRRLTDSRRVEDLHVEDRENRSYAIKTLACAMWALRQLIRTPPAKWTADFFVSTIRRLASRGGDATANCAIAGAVLGSVMGEKNLPLDWIKALPHQAWLHKETDKFFTAAATTWKN